MQKNVAVVTRRTATLRLGRKLDLNRLKKQHPSYVETLHQAELAHRIAIQAIKEYLADLKLNLTIFHEGTATPALEKADLVISIGGDGTFIHASHFLKKTPILGINSAPSSSIGRYCLLKFSPGSLEFTEKLKAIVNDEREPVSLDRLLYNLDGEQIPLQSINDALISESNPATLSRYHIAASGLSEFQRSSGIWITTASGSTAAYQSSGGKSFASPDKNGDRSFGYMVREPFAGEKSKLHGGQIFEQEKLVITSAMASGSIFIDGDYHQLSFPIGSRLTVSLSPEPLQAFL